MKTEECKEIVHKCKKFSGNVYTLEDKDILISPYGLL